MGRQDLDAGLRIKSSCGADSLGFISVRAAAQTVCAYFVELGRTAVNCNPDCNPDSCFGWLIRAHAGLDDIGAVAARSSVAMPLYFQDHHIGQHLLSTQCSQPFPLVRRGIGDHSWPVRARQQVFTAPGDA
jgi:hypothetical protein